MSCELRAAFLVTAALLVAAMSAGCGSSQTGLSSSTSTRPSGGGPSRSTLASGGGSGATGYRPPRPPAGSVLAYTISPHACESWLRGLLVGTCDPDLLQRVYDNHQMNEPSKVHVTVTGRTVSGGGNPALTQWRPGDGNGLGVQPGQTVTITGPVSAGSYLYLRADNHKADVYASGEALFSRLGLEHGGTATVAVSLEGDQLRYLLHRPDGSTGSPVAIAGRGGPGVAVRIADVPAGYADNPEQAARTYIAAANARDGRTICELFNATVQGKYQSVDAGQQMPCWMLVSAFIDFSGENADRTFQSELLTKIGIAKEQTVAGHWYVGVPLTLDVRFRRADGASTIARPQLRQTLQDMLWLEKDNRGRYRVAKPSLALMAAGSVGRARNADPLAPPG